MTTRGKNRVFTLAYFRHFIRFNIVGLSGVGVNEGVLILLQALGVYVLTASGIAIEVSILSNFLLNDLWTFRDRRTGHFAVRLVKFNLLMFLGLVVNLAIVYIGTSYFGIHSAISNLVGIGAAFLLRYELSVKYAWMRDESIEGVKPTIIPQPVAGPQSGDR